MDLRFEDQANEGNILRSSDLQLPYGALSPRVDGFERTIDAGNIEEAVSDLREGTGLLNYDEARALMGRIEYNRGNVEAALRLFDGIDISAIAPKLKLSIAGRLKPQSTSTHAVILLLEALLLKSKSLAQLGKFKEAAQSSEAILEIFQAGLPASLSDQKLREVATAATKLLPGLWNKAGFPHEAVSSYRRALLDQRNLDQETAAKIRKEFAAFLLYEGMDVEEALCLLMTQWTLMTAKQISWDQSLLDHLTFALSICGELPKLAKVHEDLPSSTMDSSRKSFTLALCYSDQMADERIALDRLKKTKNLDAILLASKICGKDASRAEQGISFARRALDIIAPEDDDTTREKKGVAHLLMGISLSNYSRSSSRSDAERGRKQREAMAALEEAEALTRGQDPRVLRNLCVEHAEQRRLDSALKYAKKLLRVESGSDPGNWVLVARILSAQKRLLDAEAVVDAGMEQTDPSSQRQLLLTKARLQVAGGRTKVAVETYARLLALLQLRGDKNLDAEMEAWTDLAKVYAGISRWKDADFCLSRSRALKPSSALFWRATGKVNEEKGLLREAEAAYKKAVEIDPRDSASMVAVAAVMRKAGNASATVMRSYLEEAVRVDSGNHAAWFHLGRLRSSQSEAAECFQAAVLLEESAPVEDFR